MSVTGWLIGIVCAFGIYTHCICTYILRCQILGPSSKKKNWNIRVHFHVSGSEFDFLMENDGILAYVYV